MRNGLALALGVTLLAASARIAAAGVQDPVPLLGGQPAFQLFSVPGAISNGLTTIISCTSANATSIKIGVEWFRKDGTSVGLSSLDVAPGTTVNFGTGTTVAVPVDALAAVGLLLSGSARVLSTAKKDVLCAAYVISPAGDPPTVMMPLPVITKLKQRGD